MAARLLDRPAGEQLGLGTRHEDTGPDLELDVPEVSDAGEVLQGHAHRTTPDQLAELLRLGRA